MKINLIISMIICCSIFACTTTESTGNEQPASTTTTDNNNATQQSARMEEIRTTLIGDWIEDSVEFKRVYNMAPPPVQNTRVRYQEDGFIYIPGVLLDETQWDKWAVVNDTTIHVVKRQDAGIRVFTIDSLGQDAIKYRIKFPNGFQRKIRLLRIK